MSTIILRGAFSLTASIMVEARPSPPDSSGTSQATPEITDNTTTALYSATPTALESGNLILNLTLPTGLGDQELPADTYSDVTSADSSGTKTNDSTYLESHKNSPAIVNTTPYISAIVKETGSILEVFREVLEDLNTPRVIFNQEDDLEPTDIVEEEATQTETPLYNGGTPPLPNQPSYQSSLLIDSPDALDSTPPGVREDASDAAFLASVVNLPREILAVSDDNIFGVYQYWVHQFPGTHLYGGIE